MYLHNCFVCLYTTKSELLYEFVLELAIHCTCTNNNIDTYTVEAPSKGHLGTGQQLYPL